MALLAGIGLQHKTIDQLEKELNVPQSQLLALFNKLIKKIIDVTRLPFISFSAQPLSLLADQFRAREIGRAHV